MFRELAISELTAKGLLTRAGNKPGEIWVCCPYCVLRGKTADTEYKLGLNTYDGRAHCFRCEYRSKHGMRELGLIDFQPSAAPVKKKKLGPVELPDDFTRLVPDKSDYWMWKAWRYVRDRGMTLKQIHETGVGLCWTGAQRFRVVFPITDPEGTLVGYTGRSILNTTPKWLHMASLEGMFRAKTGCKPRVTLVEGIFDALAIERALGGVTDVVAILGSHVRTPKWLEEYRKVVLWLDPDTAGRKAAVELAEALRWNPQVMIVHDALQEPADCSPDQLLKAWKRRRPWSWNEGLQVLAGGRYDDVH